MMLEKKIAAVTGAASGIGQAIAQRFGKEGACVALLDINYEQAEKTAEEIRAAGGEFWYGIWDPADFETAVASCLKTGAKIINLESKIVTPETKARLDGLEC